MHSRWLARRVRVIRVKSLSQIRARRLGEVASLGAKVGSDRPLAIVHASSEEAAQRAARELSAAFTVTDRTAETFPVIHERVATG